MKKVIKIVLITLVSLIGVMIIGLTCLIRLGKVKLVLPVEKKATFTAENMDAYPSKLHCEGNKIINEQQEQVILKGVMVPDLEKMDTEGHFNEQFFEQVFACGGNCIRIPVHPDRWVGDEYYLWRYLDPIVRWAGEHGKYVMIDLHFIGNIKTGQGEQMPQMAQMGEGTYQFSTKFWNEVATYFKEAPHVIFEICNEPTDIDGDDWKECAKTLTDTVRSTGAKQLLLVSGTDYAYDLSCWENDPLEDENVAYVAHVYPSRWDWKDRFASFSSKYPIVVTEWGFASEEGLVKQTYLKGTRENFGEPFTQYMKAHEMGWVACWYDDGWEPPMFFDGMQEMTDWGKFVMEQLNKE